MSIQWKSGTKVWAVQRPYGTLIFHDSEESAKDALTRKDKLVSFVISEWQYE